MKMKKVLFILMSLIAVTSMHAKEAFYKTEEYEININYNNEVKQGDAIFVKMRFSLTDKKNKNLKAELNDTSAMLFLYTGEKKIDSSAFYVLQNKNLKDAHKTNVLNFLTGIPLSTYFTTKETSFLKVVYKPFGLKEYEFNLPVTIIEKDFNSETLQLDEKNSNIKNDISPRRMEEIKHLNEILGTVNPQSVYNVKAFVRPVESNRYTAFFGDRRVYAYTNGKSSTSLHYGNDYGVPEGTEVKACGDGKVVLVADRVSTGWSVVIEHLPGLYSLYYHMSSTNLKEGQMISSGELVGLSGSTGLATGPHLHWEVRLNMAAVNPDFFTQDFTFTE